ncbi:hypothetical protein Tco_0622902 [Tanacetum coccineum]
MESDNHPVLGNLATFNGFEKVFTKSPINGFEKHTKAVCKGEPYSFLGVSHGELKTSCRAVQALTPKVEGTEYAEAKDVGLPAKTKHPAGRLTTSRKDNYQPNHSTTSRNQPVSRKNVQLAAVLTKLQDRVFGLELKLMLLGINLLLLLEVNAVRHNLLLLLEVNAARHNLVLLLKVNAARHKLTTAGER